MATKGPSETPANYTPEDINIRDDYVSYTLRTTKPLPPVTLKNLHKEIQWISFFALTLTPLAGIIGACHVELTKPTLIWSVIYYFITALSITAGYHRLWSHRSYNAHPILQVFFAVFGTGAVEGSIKWWSRGHRSHHRYTDTDLDPYNAHRGFFFSHIGWMLVRPRRRPGMADVSDLNKSAVVRWQHRNYVKLIFLMGFVFPMAVAGLLWNDWWGGLVYAGIIRLVVVHHSTFCVNSLAHWLGEAAFDDKHTPKNHFITALVTAGEGYHNFHHQFPMDYRNAIRWYQYDPTKWLIWLCAKLGLATHLKMFPSNEIEKGQLTMQLKRLRETQEHLAWPKECNDLPVVDWDTFQKQATKRPLILVAGFIHDVGTFLDDHPGGKHLLVKFIGKDATTAFFGGVYNHSNAAHNLLAMKRVGVLSGGVAHASEEKLPSKGDSGLTHSYAYYQSADIEKTIPPAQRLKIARYTEISSTSGWSGASGSDED